MTPTDVNRLLDLLNNGASEFVDGSDLDDLLSGSSVIGAETINYPLTDGAIFYLKGKDGGFFEFEIRAEDDAAAIRFERRADNGVLSDTFLGGG